jgi:hypothetical protein
LNHWHIDMDLKIKYQKTESTVTGRKRLVSEYVVGPKVYNEYIFASMSKPILALD